MQRLLITSLLLFGPAAADTVNTYNQNGITLTVTDKDTAMPQDLIQHMIDTFFEVYPQERDTYNPDATDSVEFIFDPDYHEVAETNRSVITFNPEYFQNRPDDTDAVTHEAMHVVQYSENIFVNLINSSIF
jgi:hypothetical protein